jgi:uncharacterized protein YndB with AHSA1/START domain
MNGENRITAVGSVPTRRQMICRATVTLAGMALVSGRVWAGDDQGISRTAEAIHQEPVFKASRKRVYEALTDAKQFDKVVQMSEAMKSITAAPKNPTQISREVGGEFSLFEGYITGRHIELAPGERIVQAWRATRWDPHVYSIVRFELTEEGAGTKIVFDHTGFPVGQVEHLAGGWKGNYWEPLGKFLAQSEMK